MGRRPLSHPKDVVTSLRLSSYERHEMEVQIKDMGFKSISDYIRHLHKAGLKKKTDNPSKSKIKDYGALIRSHKTKLGSIYQGNSLAYFHGHAKNEVRVNTR